VRTNSSCGWLTSTPGWVKVVGDAASTDEAVADGAAGSPLGSLVGSADGSAAGSSAI
jgi:hypothetical protein